MRGRCSGAPAWQHRAGRVEPLLGATWQRQSTCQARSLGGRSAQRHGGLVAAWQACGRGSRTHLGKRLDCFTGAAGRQRGERLQRRRALQAGGQQRHMKVRSRAGEERFRGHKVLVAAAAVCARIQSLHSLSSWSSGPGGLLQPDGRSSRHVPGMAERSIALRCTGRLMTVTAARVRHARRRAGCWQIKAQPGRARGGELGGHRGEAHLLLQLNSLLSQEVQRLQQVLRGRSTHNADGVTRRHCTPGRQGARRAGRQ